MGRAAGPRQPCISPIDLRRAPLIFGGLLSAVLFTAGGLALRAPQPATAPAASEARPSTTSPSPPPVATLATSTSPPVETPSPSQARWRRLAALPSSLERDAELAALLAELAASNPDATREFLLALSDSDRRCLVAAILLDASRRPDAAVNLAILFCQVDPQTAKEHGYALIQALSRVGEFEAALRFVAAQSTSVGESEDPQKWLRALYAAWTRHHAALAAAHAAAIPSEGARDEALIAVVETWSASDPEAALRFTLQLPVAGREFVLARAAQSWAEKHPAAAAAWLAERAISPALDGAHATVATHPETLARDLPLALHSAERIAALPLRARTLAAVLFEWSARNPAAATRYLESTPFLPEADRAHLLATLNNPPPD